MPENPHLSTEYSEHFPVSHTQNKTLSSAPDQRNHAIMTTLNYREKYQHLTLQIERCKSAIEQALQESAAQEQAHDALQTEQALEARILERVHLTHLHNIDALIALEREYKQYLKSEEYLHLFEKKQEAIARTEEEIETLEHTLLHRELERLNLLDILIPKREKMATLRQKQRELEQHKNYLEKTALQQLHQNAQTMLSHNHTPAESTDTEILS